MENKKYTCKSKLKIYLLALFSLIIFTESNLFAESDNRTVVKVGYYENINFQEGANDFSIKSGYGYEYYQHIAEYAGWKYEYVYGDFIDLYKKLLSGDIDFLAGMAMNDSRKKVISYPNLPMGRESYMLVKRSNDSTISSDLSTLNEKKIGVLDSIMVDIVKKFQKQNNINMEIVLFKSMEARNQALINKNVDLIIIEDSGTGIIKGTELFYDVDYTDFYLCVNKARPDLLKKLNDIQYFMSFSEPSFLSYLNDKYMRKNIVSTSLSDDEKEWVKNHNVIKIGYLNDYAPYCSKTKQGTVHGLIKDLIEKIIYELNIKEEVTPEYIDFQNIDEMLKALQENKIDVMFPSSGGLYYAEQDQIYNSKSIIKVGVNLIYNYSYTDETLKKIAINKNSKIQLRYMQATFPDSQIVLCKSTEDCLRAVLLGKAGCTIIDSLRSNGMLKNDKYRHLKTLQLGDSDDYYFSIKVGNESLLKLLNRALSVIDSDFSLASSYQYINELYTYTVLDFIKNNTPLIFCLFVIISSLIAYLFLKNYMRMKKQLVERMQYQDEIRKAINSARSANENFEFVENSYRTLHKLVKSGMWRLYFDEKGYLLKTEWSNEFRKMLGYNDESDFPNTLHSWSSLLHPDDYEEIVSGVDEYASQFNTNEIYDVEYRLLTKDRGYRWFRATGDVSRREDKTPYCFFGVFFDITEQKEHTELEKSRNEALNQANEALTAMTSIHKALESGQWYFYYDTDSKLQKVVWSDSFRQLLGFRSEEDFPNEWDSWFNLLHPQDVEKMFESYNATVNDKTGNTTFNIENRLFTKDRGYRWFRAAGRLSRREDGSPDTFYGLFIDIDDKKKAEESLRNALITAEHASNAKTVFLNNMSHDIRTPMNAIIGFISLASSHIDDKEKVSNYLSKIATSSEHLLSLINDVLDMSRIESGKIKIEEKKLNLPTFIKDLKTIIQPNISQKNLKLSINVENIKNEDFITDKLRLNQILINILGNAIKFTKSGGEISLNITQNESLKENYANYTFSIKDNGIGISKAFQKHIFEPFTREETSTVSGIQGTGLGMAITKNIVDMMNGSITVNSESGKGSEFTVSLDFKIIESEDTQPDEQNNKTDKLLKQKALSAKNKKILLVEDNELNQEIAISILEEIGFKVDTANDGEIAVKKMKEVALQKVAVQEYGLILMDIQMPKMNGYEAVRQIRSMDSDYCKTIPILAMTANAFDEDKQAALDVGMNGHISKPINIQELLNSIMQFFE